MSMEGSKTKEIQVESVHYDRDWIFWSSNATADTYLLPFTPKDTKTEDT